MINYDVYGDDLSDTNENSEFLSYKTFQDL